MYMGFHGLSDAAQSNAQDKWKPIEWFGLPILHPLLQDLGYKTQDNTMQDMRDRSKCRIQDHIPSTQPCGPVCRSRLIYVRG